MEAGVPSQLKGGFRPYTSEEKGITFKSSIFTTTSSYPAELGGSDS